MSSEHGNDLRPPGRLKLHHMGFVLASIQQSAESFCAFSWRNVGWNHNFLIRCSRLAPS